MPFFPLVSKFESEASFGGRGKDIVTGRRFDDTDVVDSISNKCVVLPSGLKIGDSRRAY
jgi:hypothetical protein